MFPGELAAHERDGQAHSAHHTQWMLPSMGHLLHMTLMVLAGLLRTSATEAAAPRTPAKDVIMNTSDFVSFPMPPPFLFTPLKTPESRDIGGSPRTELRSDAVAAKAQPVPVQSVKCIRLGKTDEAESLWLETCKIFSELTNSMSSSASQQAVDCLRVP